MTPSRLDCRLTTRTPYSRESRLKAFVVVLIGLLLATLLPEGLAGHPAYAQAVDSSFDYPENDTSMVGWFMAVDQDGGVIEWSLSGPDRDRFTIDGGELRFKEPPNYEDPKAVAGNDYRVTVEASGGTHDVAVTVVDVDEAGTVNIDRRQPQVDRPLGAALVDEDAGVTGERWQWSRSEDGTAWTNIERATSPRRSPVPADVGTYLRATVIYSDKFGSGKTAWAVSAHRVEARTLSNAAPSFADQDRDRGTAYIDITRSVAENAAVGVHVGRAVAATDADNDVLFYELLNTPDLEDGDGTARFTIDSMSGQIRVGKELGADEGEREDEDSTVLSGVPALPDDEDADDPGNSEYVLRVKVWDPSTASAVVNVIVRITGVNEAPRFDADPPTRLSVTEGDANKRLQAGTPLADLPANVYAVEDEDAEDVVPQTGAYSLEGADRNSFSISDAGALSVAAAHTPDFEEQNSYSITIIGRSGTGSRRLTAALDVTVDVVDAEDVGEVSLSQREPQVGRVIRAAISDPDGGVRVTGWVWERSDEITVDEEGAPSAMCRQAEADAQGIPVAGGWTPIDGVSTLEYTPTPADVGRCLRATATYRDRIGDDTEEEAMGVTEAPVQVDSPVNIAPEFVDQDLSSTGDQSHRTSRRVAENTEAGISIGAPVTAHDEDGELLMYSLGGADAEFFGIDRDNGQLKTKAPLNYEARTSYRVHVIATDPSGASDTILVTINVTDVGDPVRITGIRSASFAENRSTPVATFNAYGEEGGAIRWSLSGPDEDLFTIARGVLRFREPPDYEKPKSASAGNVYRVIIEADGGTRDVTVTVTDVDEVGTVGIDRPQPQVDRTLGATLSDEDAGVSGVRWQWARSENGRIWTDIDGAAMPRLTPTPDDVGMYLRASVAYSDRFGSGKTASAVSARRVEARTLANAAPSFAGQDEDEDTAYIDITRSIPENTPEGVVLGDPLSAKDADGDLLFYELLNTPDLEDEDGDARFTIDSLSGQLRVGKKLGADPGEREDEDSTALAGGPALPQGDDAGAADNSEYVLRVMVSDPSTASATVNVVVTVTEVNEPPLFGENAPTVLRVRENTVPPVLTFGAGDTPVSAATFAVTDQDGSVTGPDGYDDTAYAYSVSGTDRNVFAIGSDGTLSFRAGHRPDFEKKSSYSISIAASSGVGSRRLTTSLNLTVNVVDTEDVGTVVLSQRQPQVGVQIVAMASDPDGDVTITRWVWERSDVTQADCRNIGAGDDFWDLIAGATSAVYVPKPSDVGRCLRATATYRDSIGNSSFESATGVLEAPVRGGTPEDTAPNPEGGFVNAAPVFPDQDLLTEGDQSDRTTREVAENTKSGQNIGAPVSAQDDDGDLLIYTLGGADAAHFSISRNDGQLKTKGALNYEARNSYTVVVTATDPSGAADSILVTINVTDVNDPPVITILDD